jgi:hypothetical protein
MLDILQPAAAGAWDAGVLAPVAELNEQLLEHLQRLARVAAPSPPRLVDALRPHWQRLEVPTLQRLAACPYLLLDAGFSQHARWDQWLIGGVMDSTVQGGYFTDDGGVSVLRRTLLLAWHLARSNRLMAAVVLGMNTVAADRIGQRRLTDLETLAEHAPAWMVPRWEQQPIVWQQMIAAACSNRDRALRQVQLRGLQLLARDSTRR